MDDSLDDIVFSGMSGRFPNCDSVDDLWNNLVNGVDMVTENDARYPFEHHGLPRRSGVLKDLTKFDASFFGLNEQQANSSAPYIRLLSEVCYESICDAGYLPEALKGSSTGVFVAKNHYDFDSAHVLETSLSLKCLWPDVGDMTANKISFLHDFNGPSVDIDSACASSLSALSAAVASIKTGECDRAIVAGVNVILDGEYSKWYLEMGNLSPTGFSYFLDERANGFVRSEAIVSILLERRTLAKRVYGSLVHVRTGHDGFKTDGITYPGLNGQVRLLRDTYQTAGVEPLDIAFVEAHGTATVAGDFVETTAISEVFTSKRTTSLPLGSIKSNIGHTEAAAGLCSLVKVLLAGERGMIPGNLHFAIPNPRIKCLHDGRVKPVVTNMDFPGGLSALSSFGMAGSGGHVIIRSNSRHCHSKLKLNIPRIVAFCGRSAEAVDEIRRCLTEQDSECLTEDFLALLDIYSKHSWEKMPFRGSLLIDIVKEPVFTSSSNGKARPVWFVMSGIGGQWSGMARGLQDIPWFKNSVDKCANALKDFGIDLWDILLTEDANVLRQIVSPYVAITSVQVALIDLMRLLNVSPDGISGFSLGEIASAYADGCLTLEQTILASYGRGRCIELNRPPPGLMAVVELSWEEASRRCPKGVLPACHSAETSVTISGPRDSVLKFVAELEAEKVFARIVATNEVALHHPDLKTMASHMTSGLENVIVNPKTRSEKWISISTKEDSVLKLVDPQYFVNNFVSPVKFYDVLKSVPKNAIIIEIGPSPLHRAAITKTLGSGVTYVNFMKRDAREEENANFLIQNLSSLYIHGLNPEYQNLYPRFQFPVGRGTPSLASLIRWRHDRSWPTLTFPAAFNKATASDYSFVIDLNDSEWSHLEGHNIDGRILFPATAYLCLVWRSFARNAGKNADQIAVTFENVVFKSATILSNTLVTTLVVRLMSDGYFIVMGDNKVLVDGKIREVNDVERGDTASHSQLKAMTSDLILNGSEIYKELRVRGYEYSGDFKGLCEASADGALGRVKWTSNWAAFLDSCLHLLLLATRDRNLIVPTAIRKVTIDAPSILKVATRDDVFYLEYHRDTAKMRTAGLQAVGIDFSCLKKKIAPATLQKYSFLEFNYHGWSLFNSLENEDFSHLDAGFVNEGLCRPLVALIVENCGKVLRVCDLSNIATAEVSISNYVNSHSPTTEVIFERSFRTSSDSDLVIFGPSNGDEYFDEVIEKMKPDSWLLITSLDGGKKIENNTFVEVANRFDESLCRMQLFRKKVNSLNDTLNIIYVNKDSTQWINDLHQQLKTKDTVPVWLLSFNEPTSGIIGFVNCLRLEPNGNRVRCIFAPKVSQDSFHLSNVKFKQAFERNLVLSVIKQGKHGFYCHQDITEEEWTESSVTSTRLSDTPSILAMKRVGDLASLHWKESPPCADIDDKDMVDVKYMAVNFHDVMQAMGRMEKKRGSGHGMEYSGMDGKGNRVMGFVFYLNSITSSRNSFIHLNVPQKWSLEEAATIPVAYCTVLCGLVTRANIQRGESILIHCGAGAIGQAALNVAKHFECKIFTTCGSEAKREFLKKNFGLTDDVIFDSRSDSFEDMLRRATKGHGVDIVLNSLSDDLLQASIRCLAPDGRFVELGKKDILKNSSLGLKTFLENKSFLSVHIDEINTRLTPKTKAMFEQLVLKYIANGAVKPILSTIFKTGQEENAFRYMTAGKHIGKVLIQLDDAFLKVERTLHFHSNKSYIIIGGLGGFGLELVHWMIEHGARKFLIVSRNGIKNSYQRYCADRFELLGAEVVISSDDISNRTQAQQVVDHALRIGPLGGIFNLAAVLKDGLFENQSIENFFEVSKSKVLATKNLDAITREMNLRLDYFVCFSSIACGKGNPGQTNYGYANSVMERICEKRFEDGLAGKAIQWGAIGDVGLVAEHFSEQNLRGLLEHYAMQGVGSCLDSLEKLLKLDAPVVASYAPAKNFDSINALGRNQGQSKKLTLSATVARALGILDIVTVDLDKPLQQFGVDSLMAVEVKEVLENRTRRTFTIGELKKLTLNEIASWESPDI